jgi:hypothetical protein
MNKIKGSIAGAAVALLALGTGTAHAQSAKNAVQLSDVTLIPVVKASTTATGCPATNPAYDFDPVTGSCTYTGPWQDILSSTLHTSSQKDLVMGVSLETGLITKTKVASKNGALDASTSTAAIEVRVKVGAAPAYPGDVVFDKREQTLIAVFGGVLTNCIDPVTGAIIITPDCVTDETLELLLDTMAAHHFNFVLDDVGVGDKSAKVQARLKLLATKTTGFAEAGALIGKGALVVEEVRLVKGADVLAP